MKLLPQDGPSLFSCMYSRVKLFIFAMNCRRRYFIFVCFIYGRRKELKIRSYLCRLPLTSCLTSLIIAKKFCCGDKLFFPSNMLHEIHLVWNRVSWRTKNGLNFQSCIMCTALKNVPATTQLFYAWICFVCTSLCTAPVQHASSKLNFV